MHLSTRHYMRQFDAFLDFVPTGSMCQGVNAKYFCQVFIALYFLFIYNVIGKYITCFSMHYLI